MKKHFTIKVSGHVQGVNFRATIKKTAANLNLTGYAKNESDGSVTIEVEGREESINCFLDQFKGQFKKFPTPIKINEFKVQENQIIKNYLSFET